jgi:enamine deaminase RidA (YjgF/YER057c/UK114 family)
VKSHSIPFNFKEAPWRANPSFHPTVTPFTRRMATPQPSALATCSSSQDSSRPDGSPEPDFASQVRLAFDNLRAVLAAAGCSLDDVVDVTSFHTDPEAQFGTVMAEKQAAFPTKPYPNWTAVGVSWLAGFDFEIKVIARIPAAG